jgi:hypothetical protein
MKTTLRFLLATGALAAAWLVLIAPLPAADTPPAGKVYDMRVYKANPGKLEALHARFREQTCTIFKKHGMELIGF